MGKHIKTYESLSQAAQELGIDKKKLSKICLSTHKTYDGSIWAYDLKEPYRTEKDHRRKRVAQFNKQWQRMGIYDSAAFASAITGIHKSSIVKACRGERKQVQGFYFYYWDESINESNKSNSSITTISPLSETVTTQTSTNIYVTDSQVKSPIWGNPSTTKDLELKQAEIDKELEARFAPFMDKPEEISIRKKLRTDLNLMDRTLLAKIHPDRQIARETCLVILSNLTFPKSEEDNG